MIAIAYLDENNKGATKYNDPWVRPIDTEMPPTIDEVASLIMQLKNEGAREITVFHLPDDGMFCVTWDYVWQYAANEDDFSYEGNK